MTAQSIETVATAPQHGAEIIVPLNRLKASPKNARKTPHNPATIEAFAASIKAKGVLQPPVIEIERDGEGEPTCNYLVTIGEGRRQGLRLLARRKAIKRTHPVRVIVDGQTEFGAAWKKTSRENREYLSVKLDDPSFPGPIYASLVEIDGSYSLIWSR